jgi:hypothetical protein
VVSFPDFAGDGFPLVAMNLRFARKRHQLPTFDLDQKIEG